MSTRFIQNFGSVNEIENDPESSGIGCVDGVPYMRTSLGVMSIGPSQVGKSIFLDPANGSDNNSGLSPNSAVATLAAAYALATDGEGDVIFLMSNGTTTATARLGTGFTWAKNNTHLVGLSSGVNISNRSRIAPTANVSAFTPFFTVSGNGCLFQNIQWFHGFNTGMASQICLVISGGRNAFVNCHIAGMGDAASAADAGSRCLTIATTGENQFLDCTIGLDTEARSAANAILEFLGVGNPRNVFRRCRFIMFATSASALGVKVGAAAASDRFQSFEDCTFINSINSGAGTSITGLCSLVASIGGLLFFKNPMMVGVSNLGADATSKGQIYQVGAVVGTGAGIGVNPA